MMNREAFARILAFQMESRVLHLEKKKLRGFSQRANHADRETTSFRRN
jgi:hypothetical protein